LTRAPEAGTDAKKAIKRRPAWTTLIFIVLMLNKFPQMLLREVLSLTHFARWAGYGS